MRYMSINEKWLFPPPNLDGPCMRAFATPHVGWCGYDGYILLYEFFVAFGNLSINTKVKLNWKKKATSRQRFLLFQKTFFMSIVPFAIVSEFFGSSFGKGQNGHLNVLYNLCIYIWCSMYNNVYEYIYACIHRYGSMNVYVILDIHATYAHFKQFN